MANDFVLFFLSFFRTSFFFAPDFIKEDWESGGGFRDEQFARDKSGDILHIS